MSDNEEIKQAVVDWLKKNSKPGKTKFYMKDIVKGIGDQYEKRAIQKAINDCTVDETVRYWSTGSSTLFCLTENFGTSDD